MKIIISQSQYNLLFESKLKQNLKQEIKDFGIKNTAELVNGMDNLFEILNINSPMEFLHLFDDLDMAQSEEYPDFTLFRYKPKHNLMIYDRKSKIAYINYYEIWKPLLDAGLSHPDIQELIKEWLSNVYNIRGVTPKSQFALRSSKLFEV